MADFPTPLEPRTTIRNEEVDDDGEEEATTKSFLLGIQFWYPAVDAFVILHGHFRCGIS